MVQNNAALSYACKMLLLSTEGADIPETRAMEIFAVDEDRFVPEAIHNDIGNFPRDLLKSHKTGASTI